MRRYLLQVQLLEEDAGVLVGLGRLLVFGFDDGLHALVALLQQLLQSRTAAASGSALCLQLHHLCTKTETAAYLVSDGGDVSHALDV